MIKKTKGSQNNAKSTRLDPHEFVSLPFNSVLDVYERLVLESVESYVLSIKKKLLNFESYRPHLPLRKTNFNLIEIVAGKVKLKNDFAKDIRAFDQLLKSKVINPRKDYSQFLTHLYYGLAYYSIGVVNKPTDEGKEFLDLCQKLRKLLSEQEEVLDKLQKKKGFSDLNTRRGTIKGSDFSKQFSDLNVSSLLLESKIIDECIPNNRDALLNQEYGVRLIFDAINTYKRDHLSIPKVVDLLPIKDMELETVITNYKKEKKEEKKADYYKYSNILAYEIIAIAYGIDDLAYSDVGKFITNRKSKKIKTGQSAGFSGAKDVIFSDMDEVVRKGIYRGYEERLQDKHFNEAYVNIVLSERESLGSIILNLLVKNSKTSSNDLAQSVLKNSKAATLVNKMKVRLNQE